MKILVISDIHANKYALDEILNAVSYDFLVFLGDIVDYGPHPAYCLDVIKESADVIILGNHDYAVAFNTDCRCGEKLHSVSVYTRENITKKQLTEDQMKWLKSVPIKRSFGIAGIKFLAVHATPRDPLYEYLLPNEPNERFYNSLMDPSTKKLVEADYVLIGHTHFQFKRKISGITILNPGSVGQPRDGDPRASCMLIDTDANLIYTIRIKYPVSKTISDIKQLNLEKNYERMLIKILKTGKV